MNDAVSLRLINFFEGVSFLLLLLVAMPLKYLFDLPLAVRIAGGLHGLLFLGLGLSLYQAYVNGWSALRVLRVLLMALVPGSFVWMDKRIAEWAADSAQSQA